MHKMKLEAALNEERRLMKEAAEIGVEYERAVRAFDTATKPSERLRSLLAMTDAHARRLAKMNEARDVLARAEAEAEIALAEAKHGEPKTKH